jgi:hypothetical protein
MAPMMQEVTRCLLVPNNKILMTAFHLTDHICLLPLNESVFFVQLKVKIYNNSFKT